MIEAEKESKVRTSRIHLVGSGVDTLIVNVRYCDSLGQPVSKNWMRSDRKHWTLCKLLSS